MKNPSPAHTEKDGPSTLPREENASVLKKRKLARAHTLRRINAKTQDDISAHRRSEDVLRAERNLMSAVLDITSALVVVINPDGEIQRVNRAVERLTGYTEKELRGRRVIDFLILPEEREQISAHLGKLGAGAGPAEGENAWVTKTGQIRQIAWSNTAIWDANGAVQYIVGTGIDVTEHRQAERQLEARSRELATLLDVSHNLASTLELQPLLDLTLDQLRAVVSFDGASILTMENEMLSVLAYRGPIQTEHARQLHFPLELARVNREVIRYRRPLIIADILGSTPLAYAFRETAGERLNTDFSYIRSWMGVPLVVKDRVIGMISLDHCQPNFYSADKAVLAMAFASQVAVAIENAHLYQSEQDRREVAEALRELVRVVNSRRSPEEILDTIAAQASQTLHCGAVGIWKLDKGTNQLGMQAYYGGLPSEIQRNVYIPLGGAGVGRAVKERQPITVRNIASLPQSEGEWFNEPHVKALYESVITRFPTILAVPLFIRDEVYGGVSLYYSSERDFSGEEIRLAVAFADQAALAIENARLREQAEQTAVAAERSRLARDLHDAVTQTLFSASLIAEVLPRLWERNQVEGLRRLEELRQLTRGALAEMRTLLLELRPAALMEAHLEDLLRQLTEATIGRSRVPVTLEIVGQPALPTEVRVAFYRIAQEALNNVAKHSGASNALVHLCADPERTELSIRDCGCGFDPASVPATHLGVSIMHERAQAVGAHIAIDSRPGQGTRITVTWPTPHG